MASVAGRSFLLFMILLWSLLQMESAWRKIDRCCTPRRSSVKSHLTEAVMAWVCGLMLALSGGWASADEARTHRVLIIYQDSSTLPSAMEIAHGVSRGLGELTSTNTELYTEFLDSAHFPEPTYFHRMADMMAVKYENVPLDVVVALGPEALRFLLQNRDRIAQSASVMFGDISARSLERLAPPENIGGVITAYDINRTVDLAIALQPAATDIVVISGSAEFDRYWRESARQKLGSQYRGLTVDYLSGLSLESFAASASELSPQTILLILTIFEDADGRKYRPREAVARIAAAAGAPSYGVHGTYVGSGVVGGYIATYQSIGEDIAQAVAKQFSGAAPGIVHTSNRFVVDWRQFQRWRLDANLLPANVVLLNYTPSVWQQYRWEIILIGAALVAQSLAIAGLLYERRGRRAAEKVAGHRLLELVHMNQSATAGALSASIAHELNQPLGAIRNNTRAAELVLQSENPDLELIRQILVDIRDDDQRASDIIAGLREMLKKRSDVEWQKLDVNDVVASALQILHSEADRQRVEVDFDRPPHQLPVRADRVHLQQVILNLATNALDAIREASPTERKLMLKTELTEPGKVGVSIADTGVGIPKEKLTSVFETFYTTKTGGTGLGLSIARAVVESYGGKIWAENRPGGGAIVRFILPAVQNS